MSNPFSIKAGKKPNPFAAKAKGKSVINGDKPNAFSAKAGKSTVEVKPVKTMKPAEFWPPEAYAPEEAVSSWAKAQQAKERKQYALSDKDDITVGGLRYCHVRRFGDFWSVEVHNGDKVYVFHNRWGSWMADYGQEGRLCEPAAVNVDVFEINGRYIAEMERRKLNPATGRPFPPVPEKQKRASKKSDNNDDKPKAKGWSKKGAKK